MHHGCADTIFYSSQRLAESCRDFRVAQSLEVCHLEGNSLLLLQRLQSLAHSLARVRLNEWIRFVGFSRRVFMLVGIADRDVIPAHGAKSINGTRARDRQEPRDRLASRTVIFGRLLP